jgi:hypothetical protein
MHKMYNLYKLHTLPFEIATKLKSKLTACGAIKTKLLGVRVKADLLLVLPEKTLCLLHSTCPRRLVLNIPPQLFRNGPMGDVSSSRCDKVYSSARKVLSNDAQ